VTPGEYVMRPIERALDLIAGRVTDLARQVAVAATLRQGEVIALNAAPTSPDRPWPSIDVKIGSTAGGLADRVLPNVRYFEWYTPADGDAVWLVRFGPSRWLCLGTLA